MDYISHGVEETEDMGRRLGAVLRPGAVVAYRGDLGMGKTDFDMYRLGGPEELFDIGWDDYLDRGGVCAVEWSERVAEALPEGTVTVTVARCMESEDWRRITIEGVEL